MKLFDRVQMRTDTNPSTSALTNLVVTDGYVAMSDAGVSVVTYCIVGETSGEWEVGQGTRVGLTGMSRDFVLSRHDYAVGDTSVPKVDFSEPVTVSVVAPAVCLPAHRPRVEMPPYAESLGSLAIGSGAACYEENAVAVGAESAAHGRASLAVLGQTLYRNSMAIGEASTDAPVGCSVDVRANTDKCMRVEWLGEAWIGGATSGELYDVNNSQPAPDVGTWALDMTVAGHRSDGARFVRQYRGAIVRYSGTSTLYDLTPTDISIAGGIALSVSVAMSGALLVVSVTGESGFNWAIAARAQMLMVRL
ncbi:hypothetical protein [Denitromonas halophila]|uniref:Uncharacterized protein n=1 Tax=Denitromonas halophila TaxID=1629404 RepID=A0A557QLT0_9RHOO|nr:hypothetical protein [Denitromonas halophila]TVO53860.1 hypothetical protein FHP91_13770 [Denitromonas halophila]